ncbi:GNAT family N-acetyltransferase [Paenibacillus sp. TC-CSREp1]|uniref:GNAT family N-acetyltransferase n=1 Tax=Paenibacillus sp. TC-CSREp1 TaxID=3410089 RepID=UPI003CF3C568
MEFIGQQIKITTLTEQDMEFICQLECNASLWTFEESVETKEENVKEKYRSHFPVEGETPYAYDFVIRRLNDASDKPIGVMQMWSYVDFRQSWELGFAVMPEFSGKGYGSEAARLLLQFAFDELKAHKVVGMCNAENVRSAALMQHVGMTREGIFKEELWWEDRWTDQFFFSILDREYKAMESKNKEASLS